MSIKSKKRGPCFDLREISHAELTLGALLNAIRKCCEEWTQAEFAEKLDVRGHNMCDLECVADVCPSKNGDDFCSKIRICRKPVCSVVQDMVNKDGIKLQVDVKPRVSFASS